MKRRSVLRALALLPVSGAGCLENPPGRTGPRNPPDAPEGGPNPAEQPDVRIEGFDFEETSGGELRVFGSVVNETDVRRDVTVLVTVHAGGDVYRRTSEFSVPGGEETDFYVVFEIEYGEFAQNGRVNVELV